jgi:hypothetical protein
MREATQPRPRQPLAPPRKRHSSPGTPKGEGGETEGPSTKVQWRVTLPDRWLLLGKLSPRGLLLGKRSPGPLGTTGKGERTREGPLAARGHPLVRRQGNRLSRKHPPRINPEAPSMGLGVVEQQRGGWANQKKTTWVGSSPSPRLTHHK